MKRLYCHVTVKIYWCNVLCKFLIKIESTRKRKIKEQAPQLTLLWWDFQKQPTKVFYKKNLFLKISQYLQETSVLEFLFKKVVGLKTCIFIKKKPQHRCFPVNITKFLRLSISENISDRLLLTVSMVSSGFRVQVTGLVFWFLSRRLLY